MAQAQVLQIPQSQANRPDRRHQPSFMTTDFLDDLEELQDQMARRYRRRGNEAIGVAHRLATKEFKKGRRFDDEQAAYELHIRLPYFQRLKEEFADLFALYGVVVDKALDKYRCTEKCKFRDTKSAKNPTKSIAAAQIPSPSPPRLRRGRRGGEGEHAPGAAPAAEGSATPAREQHQVPQRKQPEAPSPAYRPVVGPPCHHHPCHFEGCQCPPCEAARAAERAQPAPEGPTEEQKAQVSAAVRELVAKWRQPEAPGAKSSTAYDYLDRRIDEMIAAGLTTPQAPGWVEAAE